ncbi:DUF2716 domain-containing protein [Streptomyces sp. NPDC005151]
MADGTDPMEITGLIRRQQEAFATRCEPAEWRAYSHDPIPMDEPLRNAGFAAVGPERTLLIAKLDDIAGSVAPSRGLRIRRLGYHYHRQRELNRLAEVRGPHPRGLADIREDHGNLLNWALNVQLLETETRLVGAGWAEAVGATEFAAVRGMTGPHVEFLPHWVRWARNSRGLHAGTGPVPERRYLTAEAQAGPMLDALLAVGFRAVSTVRHYAWTPIGPPPATTRPVSMLLDDRDHDSLCDAFKAGFAFKPSHTYYPSIEEPPDSVTWHVGDVTDTRHTYGLMRDLPDDHRVALLQGIVERGLRALARLVLDAGDDNAMALYLTKADPLLILRHLLGHASVATTQVYLHLLDTQRIFRQAYEDADPDPAARREADAEFQDTDAR